MYTTYAGGGGSRCRATEPTTIAWTAVLTITAVTAVVWGGIRRRDVGCGGKTCKGKGKEEKEWGDVSTAQLVIVGLWGGGLRPMCCCGGGGCGECAYMLGVAGGGKGCGHAFPVWTLFDNGGGGDVEEALTTDKEADTASLHH
ncbi:hypothetical protein B0H34DRAFT_670741 [Crassisporium funariophilum]|nr:hypothetical protein B0H34DRAFT_670741 [Crassisporium funariophilum]